MQQGVPSRRRVLAGAVGIGLGAAAATAAGAGSAQAATGGFAHPGMLHTEADFARIRGKLATGAQPYTAGWNKLTANPHAQSTWKARPVPVVYRGSGSPENYRTLYNDIHAAYQNALRWKITGQSAHGDAARDILNAWSGTLTQVNGTADRFLAAGIYGYQFANAAELLRDYPGFDLDRSAGMLKRAFLPLSESFLTDHNGAYITNYWPNWDLVNMACVLATGILLDDRPTAQRALDYFADGKGLGAIRNAIPGVYDDGLAEWLEAGRDQGHATLGVGIMAIICEMAWNQGVDLYGYDDNRFLKGAEYVAKWNLGQNVPFSASSFRQGAPGVWSAQQSVTTASTADRGTVRPIWAMIANHYTQRRGLPTPYVAAMAAKVSPEGGGGDYGPNSGGYDQLGFGTLLYTRDRATSTLSPSTPASASPASSVPSFPTASPAAPASPAAGTSNLADTGTTDLPLIGAAGGAAALAGALLLLLRSRAQ